MKYETVKSFILFVLVGISFLLSFILWSYQPNYEYFYDTSYVNEVDIGGSEKTKNEIIEPKEVIFRNGDKVASFVDSMDRQMFYKEITSWVLYDYREREVDGRPEADQLAEIIFPSAIPAELMTNLFTFHNTVDAPDWSFERVFLTLNEETQTTELIILSVDNRKQIEATIEKSEAYQLLLSYVEDSPKLEEYIAFGSEESPIYLPREKVKLASKTLVASSIEPEQFINALFSNPTLVTQNIKEAYFTDGQRGMRILQDGRLLQFINPIQENYHRINSIDLLEKSIENINEHKGWTNNFYLESINPTSSNVRYRLHYEGYPVFDYNNLSVVEQEWREQELYQYNRPLIRIGNLLNSNAAEISSGEEVTRLLKGDKNINVESVKDIQVGYTLNYLDDTHSLTLTPSWYILYEGEWLKFNPTDYQNDFHTRGGD